MRRRLISLVAALAIVCVTFNACGSAENTQQSSQTSTSSGSKSSQELSEDDYWDQSTVDLEVLAFDGDARAMYVLGVDYDMGRAGLQQNFAEANKWYSQAADHGYASAFTQLGYMYLNGCGVDVDYDKAMENFQQAAGQGDNEGYVGIARVLLKQDQAANAQEAYQNAETAYAAADPDGMLLKAYLELNGIGCEADQPDALNIYIRLASLETADPTEQSTINEANTQLGLIYANAIGVTQDFGQALDYFKKAADAGYAKAQYYMGVMYENGLGMDTDYAQAMNYFREASEQDYAPAQNQVGYLYFNGYGVDADPAQAAYYQKLSAAQGYAEAQVNLGYMYENGYGVEQDYSTALAYYKLAEAQGYEGTSESVARVQNLIAQQQGQAASGGGTASDGGTTPEENAASTDDSTNE